MGIRYKDGVPIVEVGGCDATKTWSPFGNGAAPQPPTLIRRSSVKFWYPAGLEGSSTDLIELRTPNFGDRDRNNYNRINRESRGGSLNIYRDPNWPKIRTLVMDFSGVCDTEVDSIIGFFETTLGQEVSFLDWNSRTWDGLIITPDANVVRTGRDRNDVSIEMEVEEQ
jgi:hypothetical protein